MKIGSFNVRGLGSRVKREEVWEFFSKNKLDLCCIQETKLGVFSEMIGRTIWRGERVIWCVEDALGRSGGILTFWDDRKFSCSSAWSIGGLWL